MFIVSEFKDTLKIHPQHFNKEKESVRFLINRKYANKIIPDHGLVIGIYKILNISDGLVKITEGYSTVEVLFQLIMFKPFPGEVIRGSIFKNTENAIICDIGFFSDIIIKPNQLLEGSQYDNTNKKWKWVYEYDEENKNEFYYDEELECRFKIKEVKYDIQNKKSPMMIYGKMDEYGLGCINWW
eukprot:TRINITY_DN5278_c0_g1_i1.p1 TRINITY_DN5278_c0_g1~~TRINITY_DN5278_c0_g1_i1.p1  ORF type:complete len:184 (-),score=33.22 TRINITY_DN5278_c0_g1_i1:85-636(-)